MFGQFAPLVVGDDSRNYQTVRKLQTIIQRNLLHIAVNIISHRQGKTLMWSNKRDDSQCLQRFKRDFWRSLKQWHW